MAISRLEFPVSESRCGPRERCALLCRIVFGPWGEVADGIIRDVNAKGVRVRLRSGGDVSGQIFLEVLRTRQRHSGAVVWRRGSEVGIRLFDDVEQGIDPQVAVLRSLASLMRSQKS